jgi:uncharacterized protein (TIGR00299 family) protein
MRALIIDAQAGIAGDMFVAAAAHLAECTEEVIQLPQRLGLDRDRVSVRFSTVHRSTMVCHKFDVLDCGVPADQLDHAHHPAHGHDHDDQHAHHHHRSLSDILTMIESADLDAGTTRRALAMFQRLGAVEAEAHGIPQEDVHFHEVGAVDSIIDIVASALCIERLDIQAAYCTPICVGFGTVRTAHGTLPIPAPATDRLLAGAPTLVGDLPGEWCTPTGALVIDHLRPQWRLPAARGIHTAFGAGSKDPELRPNAVRLRLVEVTGHGRSIGVDADAVERDIVAVVSANIDDSTGEWLADDLIQRCLAAGAKDVSITPCIMKHGRPGQRVEVLCPPAHADDLGILLMRHTTTIGVRIHEDRRLMLPRHPAVVPTDYGPIAVKVATLPEGSERLMPEHDSCATAAAEHDVPIWLVYRAACSAADTGHPQEDAHHQ